MTSCATRVYYSRERRPGIHRILVVDDEQRIVSILSQFLVKMGFEVITAPGGAEAIELLRSGPKIDLMLLDMKMPNVVGFDVLREMRAINKKVKTIILTGSVDADLYCDDLLELDYHPDDIVYKPFDLFTLLEAVKRKIGMEEQNRIKGGV